MEPAQLRSMVSDWSDGVPPSEDYKKYKRAQGRVEARAAPRRVVGPSSTQLQLVRAMVRAIYDENSELRQSRHVGVGVAGLCCCGDHACGAVVGCGGCLLFGAGWAVLAGCVVEIETVTVGGCGRVVSFRFLRLCQGDRRNFELRQDGGVGGRDAGAVAGCP